MFANKPFISKEVFGSQIKQGQSRWSYTMSYNRFLFYQLGKTQIWTVKYFNCS